MVCVCTHRASEDRGGMFVLRPARRRRRRRRLEIHTQQRCHGERGKNDTCTPDSSLVTQHQTRGKPEEKSVSLFSSLYCFANFLLLVSCFPSSLSLPKTASYRSFLLEIIRDSRSGSFRRGQFAAFPFATREYDCQPLYSRSALINFTILRVELAYDLSPGRLDGDADSSIEDTGTHVSALFPCNFRFTRRLGGNALAHSIAHARVTMSLTSLLIANEIGRFAER